MRAAAPVTFVAVAALVLGPVAPGAGRPPATVAGAAEARYAMQGTRATNNAREDHGLRALRGNRCLKRFAVRQARRMATQESMYHQELGPIIEECGLASVGENVAYGYPTGRAVVWQGWMRSEGHRANILNRDFRLVAVAGRRSEDGTWYAAQVFGRRQ